MSELGLLYHFYGKLFFKRKSVFVGRDSTESEYLCSAFSGLSWEDRLEHRPF